MPSTPPVPAAWLPPFAIFGMASRGDTQAQPLYGRQPPGRGASPSLAAVLQPLSWVISGPAARSLPAARIDNTATAGASRALACVLSPQERCRRLWGGVGGVLGPTRPLYQLDHALQAWCVGGEVCGYWVLRITPSYLSAMTGALLFITPNSQTQAREKKSLHFITHTFSSMYRYLFPCAV